MVEFELCDKNQEIILSQALSFISDAANPIALLTLYKRQYIQIAIRFDLQEIKAVC